MKTYPIRLFGILIGLLLLGACSEEFIFQDSNGKLLTFGVGVRATQPQSKLPQWVQTNGAQNYQFIESIYAKPSSKGAPQENISSFGMLACLYQGLWDGNASPAYIYDEEVVVTDGLGQPSNNMEWPGGENRTLKVFAYAPYKAKGVELSSMSTKGTPVISYTVPSEVSQQEDLMVAVSEEYAANADCKIELGFTHSLTAVSVKAGDDGVKATISKVEIVGVFGKASLTWGQGSWYNHSQISSYSQDIEVNKSSSGGEYLANGEGTFMLLPQTLPSGACLRVTYNDGSGDKLITASLEGRTWEPGTNVCYTIHASDGEYVYFLEVVEPGDFSKKGESRNFSVKSYKINSVATVPMPWSLSYSEDSVNYEGTHPAWFSVDTESGSGGLDAVSSTINVNEADKTDRKRYQNQDLSMMDFQGNQTRTRTTANCYIINGSGAFKLPLIYGNAITNSEINQSAYTYTGVGEPFYNAYGEIIDGPYIEGATSAGVVWQNVDGLVTVNAVIEEGNPDFINITVADDLLTSGNALIAVYDKDGYILWSWHLWICPFEIKYIEGIKEGYYYLNVPLGKYFQDFKPESYYTARKYYLRVNQHNGIHKDFTINQEGGYTTDVMTEVGSFLYYQWGRKDPICLDYYSYESDYIEPIYMSIHNPTVFYSGDRTIYYSYDCKWGAAEDFSNYWNQSKTIYDPCPPGMCVPDKEYFDGVVLNTFPEYGGIYLEDVYFPVGGEILKSNGVISRLSTFGIYWSSSFYSLKECYALKYDNRLIYPNNREAYSTGALVLPIKIY